MYTYICIYVLLACCLHLMGARATSKYRESACAFSFLTSSIYGCATALSGAHRCAAFSHLNAFIHDNTILPGNSVDRSFDSNELLFL